MKPESPQQHWLLPGEDTAPSRRAFLRLTGFGVASAVMTGCSRGPAQKVIPYLVAPTEIVSGRAYWLATTCHGCTASCGLLAKCVDGRPIKLEGNPQHGLSRGGLCATGQAEVLSLYDSKRRARPYANSAELDWEAADSELRRLLARGGKVRLLTRTQHGPSTRAAIARFLAAQQDAAHIAYDPLSVSALLDAHAETHGRRALPSFRFDRSRVIVSFDADFLGTWISPVAYAADYARGRKPDDAGADPMSRHIQLEARMSLTGASADRRVRLAPWEVLPALATLCQALEKTAGSSPRLDGWAADERMQALGAELAQELISARGESLVVCGQNDRQAQVLAAYANQLLGNYGSTLSLARPSQQRLGDDAALLELHTELERGSVDLLIVSGVNPAYDLPPDIAASLSKASTLVVHSSGLDETAASADLVLPSSHFLEAWDDGEPELGRFSLTQPAVPPLRQGRSLRRVLAAALDDERDDLALVRDTWKQELHTRLAPGSDFEAFFDRAKHDGFVQAAPEASGEPEFRPAAVRLPAPPSRPAQLGLVLYPKVGLLDGSHAHNPWLQELPDPLSKITWDNYACLSELRAAELDVQQGDLVRVTLEAAGHALELPVVVQRGQHDDVVAVALGYGRLGTDRFAQVGPEWLEGQPTVAPGGVVGVNAAPLLALADGNLRYDTQQVKLEPVGRRIALAATQDYDTLVVPEHLGGAERHAIRSTSLTEYRADPAHAVFGAHGFHPEVELWPDDHAPTGHHWGMAVDLTSCTGCSACVIGCQSENNVPVVGKDEVRRHREMHWLRIDRYFAGEDDGTTAAHQPMFCQQCDHAPCEAVCPVLATVHSDEGLNQQVYNRCVGTRYCANTCPYKVRRFNWFDYPRNDQLQNHSLNPEVTVRTRGVMEKCTFCAQRIQEAKSEAKSKGVPLADGDIKVACQQSCPTQAIAFGDLADPESSVSRLFARQRAYGVLTELNVKPSVRYLARVRNLPAEDEHHG